MTKPAPPEPVKRAERLALVLWGLQARTYHQAAALSETHLEPLGLTMMEFDVLAHIALEPGLTQQQLAAHLTVTKGNITYQLSKLEQQGLIERRAVGRCKHLHLTSRGHARLDPLLPGLNAMHVQRFAHLSLDEQEQLARLLRKVMAAPEQGAAE